MQVSESKKKIVLKKKTEFDLILDFIVKKLENKPAHQQYPHVFLPLHHFTNNKGIAFDHIEVRRGYNNQTYLVILTRDRRDFEFNDDDDNYHTRNDEDIDDNVIRCVGHHKSLQVAVDEAMQDSDNWDRCQDCNVYSENIVNHHCVSCILSQRQVEKAPDQDKFSCVICSADRLLVHRKKLACGHQDFCQACVERLRPRQCPLCRKPFN